MKGPRVQRVRGLLLAPCCSSLLLCACDAADNEFNPASVRFDTVSTVGVAEGRDVEVFGSIAAVEPASEGSYFVLDKGSRAVSWFDVDGTYLGGASSRGEGPGEFANPLDLALTSNGRLVVLDPSNARFSRFEPSDSGLIYVDYQRSEVRGVHVCALGDRLYVHGPTAEVAIHEVGEGPDPVRSFGTPISTPGLETLGAARWIGESMVPPGPILCVRDPDLVVIVGRSSPTVRAYTPDGDPAWETELKDFRPIQLRITESGGVGAAPRPKEGIHWALSAMRWDDTLLLMQFRIQLDGGDEAQRELESRFLDLATGREVHRSTSLPLLAAARGPFVYELREHPFPQVAVLKRRLN